MKITDILLEAKEKKAKNDKTLAEIVKLIREYYSLCLESALNNYDIGYYEDDSGSFSNVTREPEYNTRSSIRKLVTELKSDNNDNVERMSDIQSILSSYDSADILEPLLDKQFDGVSGYTLIHDMVYLPNTRDVERIDIEQDYDSLYRGTKYPNAGFFDLDNEYGDKYVEYSVFSDYLEEEAAQAELDAEEAEAAAEEEAERIADNKRVTLEALQEAIPIMVAGDLSPESLEEATQVLYDYAVDPTIDFDLEEPDDALTKLLGSFDEVYFNFYIPLVEEASRQGNLAALNNIATLYNVNGMSDEDDNKYYYAAIAKGWEENPNSLNKFSKHARNFLYLLSDTNFCQGRKASTVITYLMNGLVEDPSVLEEFIKNLAMTQDDLSDNDVVTIRKFINRVAEGNDDPDEWDWPKTNHDWRVIEKYVTGDYYPSDTRLSTTSVTRSGRSDDLQRRDWMEPGNKGDVAYDVNYDDEDQASKLFDPHSSEVNTDIDDPNAETEDDIIDRIDKEQERLKKLAGIKKNTP